MERFWRLFDRMTDLLAVAAGILMAFMTLAICYGVVMRYFLNDPSIWVVQICEYSLLWIVFMGSTWLLRHKGHVAVDILSSRLGDKARSLLNITIFFMAGVSCGLITFFGGQYTMESIRYGVTDVRALTVPKYLVFIIIPFGSLLLSVQFFRMLWEQIMHVKRG